MSGKFDHQDYLNRLIIGRDSEDKGAKPNRFLSFLSTTQPNKADLSSLVQTALSKDITRNRSGMEGDGSNPLIGRGQQVMLGFSSGLFQQPLRSKYQDPYESQNQLQDTFKIQGNKPPDTYVTGDQLKRFGWKNVNDNLVRDLNNSLEKYGITTPARIRHFLSQCAKESGKGEWTTEQDFGDKTYFQRYDDEAMYKGAGYIQLTGQPNYEKFSREVNDQEVLVKGAEHVAEKYPWTASGFWWKANNMNDLVDKLDGMDPDSDVDKVTSIVNYYTDEKSKAERRRYYKELLGIFPD